MSEVHHKAETQDVRPMTDCLGGGLDEGADTQDTHDPGRRDALVAGDASQDGRWLNEHHRGSPQVKGRKQPCAAPLVRRGHRRRLMSVATAAAAAPAR